MRVTVSQLAPIAPFRFHPMEFTVKPSQPVTRLEKS